MHANRGACPWKGYEGIDSFVKSVIFICHILPSPMATENSLPPLDSLVKGRPELLLMIPEKCDSADFDEHVVSWIKTLFECNAAQPCCADGDAFLMLPMAVGMVRKGTWDLERAAQTVKFVEFNRDKRGQLLKKLWEKLLHAAAEAHMGCKNIKAVAEVREAVTFALAKTAPLLPVEYKVKIFLNGFIRGDELTALNQLQPGQSGSLIRMQQGVFADIVVNTVCAFRTGTTVKIIEITNVEPIPGRVDGVKRFTYAVLAHNVPRNRISLIG